jgi:hypothetical protein
MEARGRNFRFEKQDIKKDGNSLDEIRTTEKSWTHDGMQNHCSYLYFDFLFNRSVGNTDILK